ncbi:MAG: putative GNAT superfamily acetyltransferase [Planctomycetota bacterium]|jgi:predicted GNAT superfamily acetyltransferase
MIVATMKQVTTRDYAPEDAAAVLALNQDNVPEVGSLDADGLERLIAQAHWVPVVEVDAQIVGFAILLVEGADYRSTNYGWFAEQHDRFLYVDRIALGPGARSQGIGQSLYREAQSRAEASDRPVLCAEVNTIPMNEPSLRFHQRFGFEERMKRCPYGDESEVVMLELAISHKDRS